jgi:hypothetical protein
MYIMYKITQIIVTINLHSKDKLEIVKLYNVLDLTAMVTLQK